MRLLLVLLTLAFLAAPAAADRSTIDADGDAILDVAESNACGRLVLSDILVGAALHPWAGECASSSDYRALSASDFDDTDGDGLADVVEEALCYYEDRNDPSDGTCVDGDYAAP